MPYQLVFAAYLAVTTANSMLSRRYASKTTLHPLVSGILTNITLALPLSIGYLLLTDGFVMPTVSFLMVAIVEALAGSAYGVHALYAQKHTDASTFTTLVKTHVLLVIGLSGILLGESLRPVQILGAIMITSSGVILSKGLHLKGLRYSLMSIPLLTMVVLLGRTMVKQSSVGMYLVTATSLGLLIKLLFKGREFRAQFAKAKAEYKQRAVLSIFTFAQILLFILSVDLSGNVSLISSLANIKIITVMAASYVFLGEKSNVPAKVLASILSIVGLSLM